MGIIIISHLSTPSVLSMKRWMEPEDKTGDHFC